MFRKFIVFDDFGIGVLGGCSAVATVFSWFVALGALIAGGHFGFVVLFLLPTILALAIPLFDLLADQWIRMATNDEQKWGHKAFCLFFKPDDGFITNPTVIYFDRAAILAFNFTLYLFPISVMALFPQLLFIGVPVAILLGLFFGSATLFKKVYNVNKTLTNHVNDNTIHRSNDNVS